MRGLKEALRHTQFRHARRVMNTQNHSVGPGSYCNNDESSEKVWWSCRKFLNRWKRKGKSKYVGGKIKE